MADHPIQQLSSRGNAAASRADAEIKLLQEASPTVLTEDRYSIWEPACFLERLGKVRRADEPVRIALEGQAVTALEIGHARFDLNEDEFAPFDG